MEKKNRLSFKKVIYVLFFGLFICTLYLYYVLETGNLNLNIKCHYGNEKPLHFHSSLIFEAKRFVHLDLKGAPPQISYYRRLFPFFAKLGVNGVLIEYEDMFPYSGNILTQTSAKNAYTLREIQLINSLAMLNNLSVIPLVQTFGHLEFILKLKQFRFLREVERYPQVICPTHNMTLKMLSEMLDQIINAHPESTMIHIGADEVFYIGQCNTCRSIMHEKNISNDQLFLTHVKTIASLIKAKHPQLKVLIWDDGLRKIKEEELKNSNLSKLVEPVVWKYTTDVTLDINNELLDKYSNVFKTLWFASAFKGATGSFQYLPSISHHVLNHESWMKTYNYYKYKGLVEGIFITGWQRYDHFAMLCELLPVGIPSLAYSLAVLSGSEDLNSNTIVHLLDCKNYSFLTSVDIGMPYCKYPGAEVLEAVLKFHHFKRAYQKFKESSSVAGWLGNYNSDYNLSSPAIIDWVLTNLNDFLSELASIDSSISKAMVKIYDEYTILEWQGTYIKPLYRDIDKMMAIANRLFIMDNWPRRP